VVQDKKGTATLVWSRVSTTGETRMRTARFSGGEWTAGPDAAPPTDDTNIRNRAENLWLDGDDVPVLTVRTDEVKTNTSTLWSVDYPVSGQQVSQARGTGCATPFSSTEETPRNCDGPTRRSEGPLHALSYSVNYF
jgi:hypothetical protein